jgi:hypothetical protein
MIRKLLMLIVFINGPIWCLAQEKWQLIKNEDGIEIYTRRQTNSKFKEVRADFSLKATEAQLITVLQDISHHKDWSYGTKRTYLISKKNNDTLVYYSEVSLPWPLSNRDLVIELSFKRDTLTKMLHIRAKSLPGIVPVNPNLVRVPASLASWDVSELPGKLLRVQYTLSADPGGALPAWLVNLAASSGPYNSFTKLKEIIQKQNTH